MRVELFLRDWRFSVTIDSMGTVEKFAQCESCDAIAPPPDLDVYGGYEESVPIKTLAELEALPCEKTKLRHTVDITGVLGEYSLNEDARCSHDDHRHRHGLVVRARCGVLLNIGTTCLSQVVQNHRMVDTVLSERRKYFAFMGAEKSALERLQSRYKQALQSDELVRTFWERLLKELPTLAGPVQEQIQDRFTESNNVPDYLAFLRPDRKRVSELGRRIRDLRDRFSQWDRPPTRREQTRYSAERQEIEHDLAALEPAIEQSRVLLTRDGMQAIINNLDSEDVVKRVFRFSARLGRDVNDVAEVRERTSRRWDATDEGIREYGSGKLMRIDWGD